MSPFSWWKSLVSGVGIYTMGGIVWDKGWLMVDAGECVGVESFSFKGGRKRAVRCVCCLCGCEV
jgi:hypothetical protein